MALAPDSPARDRGNDALAPATDQRGVVRPSGLASDIGAFEYGELRVTLALDPPRIFGANLTLTWLGGPGIRLQRTGTLTQPTWQDVPGSEGQSTIELPLSDAAGFFRLVRP